jgi:hypothetical protein
MRFPATGTTVRSVLVWFVALIAAAGTAVAGFAALAPAAQAAEALGVESFFAGNCKEGFKTCNKAPPGATQAEEVAKAEKEGFTQAAGHPPYGITEFVVANNGATSPFPATEPLAVVTHVRTDVGPGVSTSPEAVAKCSLEEFGAKEAIPGTGFYAESQCAKNKKGEVESKIGVNNVTAALFDPKTHAFLTDLALEGDVYNLVQPEGLSSDFGVALELPMAITGLILKEAFAENPLPESDFPGGKPEKELAKEKTEKELEEGQYYAHSFIEGHVEWGKEAAGTDLGNYHDYYEINVSPELPVISSRLTLYGNIGTTGQGGFITNPSHCAGTGEATRNKVTLTSLEGQVASKEYFAPIGTQGCDGASPFSAVPFEPSFALNVKTTPSRSETTQSDQPTGLTTELKLPHPTGHGENETDSSQLENTYITLPEGMTLNPSAANGLEACKPSQIHMGERKAAECPSGSKIGTVTINVPDLPPESLKGSIYLGGSESGQINGQPYTIYLNAESERYGVTVRIQGTVEGNATTGRVLTKFEKTPEQPISEVKLHFKGGPLAPIANPLACGTATTETRLEPYIGAFATKTPSTAFVVDNNGAGEPCPATIPFAPTQSSETQPATAGASTNFTFTVNRSPGQQYLTQIKTVLPAGLVGRVPAVSLCNEAQVAEAAAGTGGCPASSRIGSVSALAGAGSSPYRFEGSAYLTGPYNGAPYGLALVVPANAGPFHLGNVVTHETINVEPYSARVVVAGGIPAIYKGIPLRLQRITVEVNAQGFMLNPTSCLSLLAESTLTGMVQLGSSTFTTAEAKSPLVTEGCKGLSFKPTISAIAGAKTSRTNGANVEVKISQPAGQANIQQVTTTLPSKLPVRLSTLAKACPAATFEAGPPPGGCKSEANVGTVKATTPVLPGTLTGTAWLVSHGNEAYPNFDLILKGDGVTVILVGRTKIANSQITTTFSTIPDVPVSSFSLYLPSGPNSVLGANGKLCRAKMRIPTTLVGQNTSLVLVQPNIAMRNCPVEIIKHKTKGTTATLNVQIPAAGSISGSGTNLKFTKRNVGSGGANTVKVSLTPIGKEVLRRFRTLRVKVRVGFVPKSKNGNITSKTFATVTFRA